jgi:hypothetical protein
MPGFGGSPFAALAGSIPGALVAREELTRKRSREDLALEQLQQAIEIAGAQESRAAGIHPLTLESLRQGIDLGGVNLDQARLAQTETSGLLGLPEFGLEGADNPVAAQLRRAAAARGDFGAVQEGLFPFGFGEGGIPQTLEGALDIIKRESAAGAEGRLPSALALAREQRAGQGGVDPEGQLTGMTDQQLLQRIETARIMQSMNQLTPEAQELLGLMIEEAQRRVDEDRGLVGDQYDENLFDFSSPFTPELLRGR